MNTLFKHSKFAQKDFENTNKTVYLFQKKQFDVNSAVKGTVNKIIKVANESIIDKSKTIKLLR